MAGTHSNPDDIWGPNQNYAARVTPRREDQSVVAGPGSYYGGSGGNVVDRNRINKTLNTLSKNETQARPLGQPGTTGF